MIISAKKEGSLWHCYFKSSSTGVVYEGDLTETEYNYRKILDQITPKLTIEELKLLKDAIDTKCSDRYEEGRGDEREYS